MIDKLLGISATQKKIGIVLLLIVGIVALIVAVEFFPTVSNQGYAPTQPIPFSHKIHAGQNKIPCAYCHVGVEKSKHASVPAVNVCMNCHKVVKTDSPHVQKIHEAFNEGKPIEWVRIHEVPDYVYFPHKRHVQAGVSCETCHGNVKEMDVVAQFAPLTMGWCMECHRGQTTPRQVLQRFYPGMKNPHGKDVAPTSCVTCHH